MFWFRSRSRTSHIQRQNFRKVFGSCRPCYLWEIHPLASALVECAAGRQGLFGAGESWRVWSGRVYLLPQLVPWPLLLHCYDTSSFLLSKPFQHTAPVLQWAKYGLKVWVRISIVSAVVYFVPAIRKWLRQIPPHKSTAPIGPGTSRLPCFNKHRMPRISTVASHSWTPSQFPFASPSSCKWPVHETLCNESFWVHRLFPVRILTNILNDGISKRKQKTRCSIMRESSE